jgi:hypothetical protein
MKSRSSFGTISQKAIQIKKSQKSNVLLTDFKDILKEDNSGDEKFDEEEYGLISEEYSSDLEKESLDLNNPQSVSIEEVKLTKVD